MKAHTLARTALAAVAFLAALVAIGCKEYRSFWINVTVVNQTGAPVRDIEVDYPIASFGINLLAPGAVYHYRLKVNGHGPISAQYLGAMDKTIHAAGPDVRDNEQGQLTISLLPQEKIQFAPQFSMGH